MKQGDRRSGWAGTNWGNEGSQHWTRDKKHKLEVLAWKSLHWESRVRESFVGTTIQRQNYLALEYSQDLPYEEELIEGRLMTGVSAVAAAAAWGESAQPHLLVWHTHTPSTAKKYTEIPDPDCIGGESNAQYFTYSYEEATDFFNQIIEYLVSIQSTYYSYCCRTENANMQHDFMIIWFRAQFRVIHILKSVILSKPFLFF